MLRPFCFEEMFSLTFAEDEATLFSFLLCSVFPALFFFPALSFLVANATTKLSAGDQISNLSTKVISFCHFSCFFFPDLYIIAFSLFLHRATNRICFKGVFWVPFYPKLWSATWKITVSGRFCYCLKSVTFCNRFGL